jgi:hypothetical protein
VHFYSGQWCNFAPALTVSDYGSLTNAVISGFHGNYIIAAVSLVGAMVAGNIIRIIVSNVLGVD